MIPADIIGAYHLDRASSYLAPNLTCVFLRDRPSLGLLVDSGSAGSSYLAPNLTYVFLRDRPSLGLLVDSGSAGSSYLAPNLTCVFLRDRGRGR